MCGSIASCQYLIQREDPSNPGQYRTSYRSDQGALTNNPIFKPTKLSMTQVANSDVNANIRLAIANKTSGKVVGQTDLTVSMLTDKTEY
jgi:hypothetical protein